ncbi:MULTISPECIES: TetR/AcrR family transcriptional regulator [unclassified Streptomyces]|uniref:TetR/AcrR family transcriptional regulator n=1 Tax=unclassified Streptomyces TaxID=2593676 RepID=UPI0033E2EE37
MNTRREQTSAESRSRLIAAAGALFAEKGYRATRFEDVAQRAGISRGSIPWHFGNKAGLLEAVLADFSQLVYGQFEASTADMAGSELLGSVIATLGAALRMPESALFTSLALTDEPGGDGTQASTRLRAGLRGHLATVGARLPLRAGVTPDDFALALVAHATGLHLIWRNDPQHVDLDHALEMLRDMLEKALLDNGAPTRARSEAAGSTTVDSGRTGPIESGSGL